jgi:hypothetical protein
MRVVLIKAASGYGALGLFIDALAEAFQRRGHEPVVIDAAAEADLGAALLRTAAEGPAALAYSFGFGEFRSADDRSVGELVGAPHVVHHVDYPLTHALRLDETPRETALLVVDESHVDAIAATYGPDHFAFVGFCPHAAIGAPVAVPDSGELWAAARPIPILFSGTFYAPGPPPWRQFRPPLAELFDAAFELALACEWFPAMDALRRVLEERGLDLDAPDLLDVRRAATFVHEQVRAHRREQLIDALARAGAPVLAVGKGWEPALARYGNVEWAGEASLEQALALMAHARLVLNVNANFGAGSHERPLSALLAGAAAASDHSRFWAERFRAGREMLLYSWTALDDGVERIVRLAADPPAASALAAAGQARVIEGHLWEHRVDLILAAAQAARARLNRERGACEAR